VFSFGKRVSGHLALLAAALIAACALSGLAAPAAGAVPACPEGKVCTDETGKYVLDVPPLPTAPPYSAYRDCVWQVHVDFGDGTAADYTFEGEVGLSGSHTFPHFGEYQVAITLSHSHHKAEPAGPECLNPPQKATVLYRNPSKYAEEEAKEAAAKTAKEQRVREERETAKAAKELEEREVAREKQEREERAAHEKPKGTGSRSGGDSGEEGGSKEAGGSTGIVFWTDCHHEIYAHRVACGKARSVVKSAGAKLTKKGSAKVAGFSCRYDPSQIRPLTCRRGKSRITGPPV
jgi:hypothetical protein